MCQKNRSLVGIDPSEGPRLQFSVDYVKVGKCVLIGSRACSVFALIKNYVLFHYWQNKFQKIKIYFSAPTIVRLVPTIVGTHAYYRDCCNKLTLNLRLGFSMCQTNVSG